MYVYTDSIYTYTNCTHIKCATLALSTPGLPDQGLITLLCYCLIALKWWCPFIPALHLWYQWHLTVSMGQVVLRTLLTKMEKAAASCVGDSWEKTPDSTGEGSMEEVSHHQHLTAQIPAGHGMGHLQPGRDPEHTYSTCKFKNSTTNSFHSDSPFSP